MNIVRRRGWFFLFSALVLLPGVISLLIPPRLTLGIEFSSGSALEITFVDEVEFTVPQVRAVLDDEGHPEAVIQRLGDNSLFIRTDVLKEGVARGDSEQQRIRDALETNLGPIALEGYSFESVSAIVARETVQKTIWAAIAATVGIMVYVTWAFRNVPNPFRYGIAAILALVHDVVIVVGIFSLLGKTLGTEVNAMFIVGLLTVAGYSVNDTIVVFDRIRENVVRSINVDRPLETIVNTSLLESLARSLNTSLTTLLVVLALLLIGGPTIRPFLLVLAIGVVVGTYSSIFIASPFLVMWERGEVGRLFRRRRRPASTA